MAAYLNAAFNSDVLLKALNDSSIRFFLAKEGDSVIGYIKLNDAPAQTELQDDASMELERIYVLQEYQRMGFGKQLLDKAIQYAKDHGKSYLWLGVWEKNSKAIRFYEKNGFRKFSEHIFVMGDDPQTDYLMRIDL